MPLVDLARQGKSALLIAPTGGGKTLAGFLPSLIELIERRQAGEDLAHKKGKGELHTLYISPLKALATDIRRNLETADRRDAACRCAPRAAPATRRRAAACASASGRPIS